MRGNHAEARACDGSVPPGARRAGRMIIRETDAGADIDPDPDTDADIDTGLVAAAKRRGAALLMRPEHAWDRSSLPCRGAAHVDEMSVRSTRCGAHGTRHAPHHGNATGAVYSATCVFGPELSVNTR
jgi:hypothetical protein